MLPARPWLSAFLLALVLSACGRDPDPASPASAASADESDTGAPLPTPAGDAGRSVTGMPPTRQSAPEPEAVADAQLPLDPASVPETPADGSVPPSAPEVAPPGDVPPAAGPAEPTVGDAVATLRDYYAAINAGNFSRAYALWSDHGRSSGQAPEQFAAGFAQTRSVSVEIGPPSRLEAAAGSRFLQLPVTVTAIQRDGSERRYSGSYTLQRAVVDGATPEQRAWRIASASLRETAGG